MGSQSARRARLAVPAGADDCVPLTIRIRRRRRWLRRIEGRQRRRTGRHSACQRRIEARRQVVPLRRSGGLLLTLLLLRQLVVWRRRCCWLCRAPVFSRSLTKRRRFRLRRRFCHRAQAAAALSGNESQKASARSREGARSRLPTHGSNSLANYDATPLLQRNVSSGIALAASAARPQVVVTQVLWRRWKRVSRAVASRQLNAAAVAATCENGEKRCKTEGSLTSGRQLQ